MAKGKQERIEVAIRKRPLNARELQDREPDVWVVDEQSCTVSGRGEAFQAGAVFGAQSTTAQVYDAKVRGIVDHAINGWNGTIFAYGQTSSGKTHTVLGDAQGGGSPGLLPLAFQTVFDKVGADQEARYVVNVHPFEIFNDRITDLVSHDELQLLDSSTGEPRLKPYNEHLVRDAAEAMQLVAKATASRRTAQTAMNDASSRSHLIIRTRITRCPKGGRAQTESILNFVDLAGSESVRTAQTVGETQREGGNINKSLAALQRVIDELAPGRETAHIPYRDSKLTRVLKTSLGGNARTVIVCCITGAERHSDTTLSTLRFARNAARVQNKPIQCISSEKLSEHVLLLVERMVARGTGKERAELEEALRKKAEQEEAYRLDKEEIQGLDAKAQGMLSRRAAMMKELLSAPAARAISRRETVHGGRFKALARLGRRSPSPAAPPDAPPTPPPRLTAAPAARGESKAEPTRTSEGAPESDAAPPVPAPTLEQQQAAVAHGAAVIHAAEAAVGGSAAELAAEQRKRERLAELTREAEAAREQLRQAEAELRDLQQQISEGEQGLQVEEAKVEEVEEDIVEAAGHGLQMLKRRQRLDEQVGEAEAELQRTKDWAAGEAAKQDETLQAAMLVMNQKRAKVEADRTFCQMLEPVVREHQQLEREAGELEREAKRRRRNREQDEAQRWQYEWNQRHHEERVEARRQHWATLEQQALAEKRKAVADAQERLQRVTAERDARLLEIHRIRRDRADHLAHLREQMGRWEAEWAEAWAAREAESARAVEAARAKWAREEQLTRDAARKIKEQSRQQVERGNKELQAVRELGAQRLRELGEKHSAELSALAEASERELRSIREEKLREEEAHAARMQALRAEAARIAAASAEELDAQAAAWRAAHEERLAAQGERSEQAMREKRAELDRVRAESARRLAEQRQQQQAARHGLEAQHAADVAATRQRHEAELRAIEQDIAAITERREAEMREAREQLAAAVQRNNLELAEAKMQQQAELGELRKRVAAAEARLRQQLEGAQAEALQLGGAAPPDAAEGALGDQASFEAALQGGRAAWGAAKRQLEQEHQASMQRAAAEQEQREAAAESRAASELAAAGRRANEERLRQGRELGAQRQAHAAATERLKRDSAARVEEVRKQLRAEEERLASDEKKLRSGHQRRAAAAQAQAAAEQGRLEAEAAAACQAHAARAEQLAAEVTRAEAARDAQLAKLHGEHEAQAGALRSAIAEAGRRMRLAAEQAQAEREAAEAAARAMMGRLRERAGAAVRLAEEEAARTLAEATALHEQRLGDCTARVAALEGKLGEAQQGLRAMQDAHAAQKAELERQLAAAVEAERARRRAELAELKRRAALAQEQSEAERLAAEDARRRAAEAQEQRECLYDAELRARLQKLIDDKRRLTAKRDRLRKERKLAAERLTAAEVRRDEVETAARRGAAVGRSAPQQARPAGPADRARLPVTAAGRIRACQPPRR